MDLNPADFILEYRQNAREQIGDDSETSSEEEFDERLGTRLERLFEIARERDTHVRRQTSSHEHAATSNFRQHSLHTELTPLQQNFTLPATTEARPDSVIVSNTKNNTQTNTSDASKIQTQTQAPQALSLVSIKLKLLGKEYTPVRFSNHGTSVHAVTQNRGAFLLLHSLPVIGYAIVECDRIRELTWYDKDDVDALRVLPNGPQAQGIETVEEIQVARTGGTLGDTKSCQRSIEQEWLMQATQLTSPHRMRVQFADIVAYCESLAVRLLEHFHDV